MFCPHTVSTIVSILGVGETNIVNNRSFALQAPAFKFWESLLLVSLAYVDNIDEICIYSKSCVGNFFTIPTMHSSFSLPLYIIYISLSIKIVTKSSILVIMLTSTECLCYSYLTIITASFSIICSHPDVIALTTCQVPEPMRASMWCDIYPLPFTRVSDLETKPCKLYSHNNRTKIYKSV